MKPDRSKLDREDRFFLLYAGTYSLDRARTELAGDSELEETYSAGVELNEYEALKDRSVADFVLSISELARKALPVAQGSILWFRYFHKYSLTPRDLSRIRGAYRQTRPDDQVMQCLLDIWTAQKLQRDEEVARAEELTRDALSSLDRAPSSLFRRYCMSVAHSQLGVLAQRIGNYAEATQQLTRACQLSEGLLLECSNTKRLATLYWATGQFRTALELHTNERTRSIARECGLYEHLTASHLSAAKCAIDLKATSKAEAELSEAEAILPMSSNPAPYLEGYLKLYFGELLVQRGDFGRGEAQLGEAIEHFTGITPPFHEGVLEAKIALSHFFLYSNDHRSAFLIIQKLLEEAEEKRCMEARSRLLLLETYLYLTDEPPLREAFDDLVTRVHLINNPAILLRALGNLYTYSLEFLDEKEQAFLLMRIKNLRKVLEESCYEDLYRRYVTERYEYAIENRLARYVDDDWDGWNGWSDPEAAIDEIDPEDGPN